MAKTVLVVDDDVKTTELVKLYLEREGYRVLTAYDGSEALRIARESRPDLMVLDLMLPEVSGFDVFRAIRAESDMPVVMLTARTSEQDRLAGLDLGADDYVTKPFSPRELAARVRAVLRRLPEDELKRGPEEIRHGELLVNFSRHEAFLSGNPLKLTPVEFKILGVFAREPGRVFNREQLIGRVFGYDFEGLDRTIDVHIFNLRRKLERDPRHPKYIKMVYGIGYKLI